ncbi:hypothetical protein ACJMK2_007834 [Sinanodonta woodiana]|uniref:DZIP3-like HEPN domain-containing protein n=1 Tax=Sinanodonta woodiana TaxID=1069815 RepID=A0ABD3VMR3_SINWO
MAEKENFFRFCGLLQDIGAKVLREVFFDKYVGISGNSTLAGYLANYKQHLASLLPNTLRIEQFDLLYPSSGGAPVIEDLDITLLCLLFRNLDTQTKSNDSIWNDPRNHQTYQADVTRIRLIRNKFFGHVSSASMSNAIYNNEVSNLTTIYQRLVQSLPVGRMSYIALQELIHKELNDPLTTGLDKEVKRLKEEMQERYRNGEILKNFLKMIHFALYINQKWSLSYV